MDLQTRHMALSSLFTETLMMMNNSSVTTAESLRGSLRKWIDSKVRGLLAMPLLTAACQSLASVRHMAETTEACITAYFNEGRSLSAAAACLKNFDRSWMPIKYESSGILTASRCPVLELGFNLVSVIRAPFFVPDGSQLSHTYVL